MLDMGTVFLSILMMNFSSVFFFLECGFIVKLHRQLKIYVISPKHVIHVKPVLLCAVISSARSQSIH